MGHVLHGSARTTEVVRRAIQHTEESPRALTKRHGVNPRPSPSEKKRTSTVDLPTGPKDPRSASLSIEERTIMVASAAHATTFRRLPLRFRLQSRISRAHRCTGAFSATASAACPS
jgi:hypothetical protein